MEHELPRWKNAMKLKSVGIDSQITNTQIYLEFKKFSNISSSPPSLTHPPIYLEQTAENEAISIVQFIWSFVETDKLLCVGSIVSSFNLLEGYDCAPVNFWLEHTLCPETAFQKWSHRHIPKGDMQAFTWNRVGKQSGRKKIKKAQACFYGLLSLSQGRILRSSQIQKNEWFLKKARVQGSWYVQLHRGGYLVKSIRDLHR